MKRFTVGKNNTPMILDHEKQVAYTMLTPPATNDICQLLNDLHEQQAELVKALEAVEKWIKQNGFQLGKLDDKFIYHEIIKTALAKVKGDA